MNLAPSSSPIYTMKMMSSATLIALTTQFFECKRWMFHPSSSFSSFSIRIPIGSTAVSAQEAKKCPGAVNAPSIPKNCPIELHLNTIHPLVTNMNTIRMFKYLDPPTRDPPRFSLFREDLLLQFSIFSAVLGSLPKQGGLGWVFFFVSLYPHTNKP